MHLSQLATGSVLEILPAVQIQRSEQRIFEPGQPGPVSVQRQALASAPEGRDFEDVGDLRADIGLVHHAASHPKAKSRHICLPRDVGIRSVAPMECVPPEP